MNSQIQLLSPLNSTDIFANSSKTRSEKATALYQLAGEKILNNPNSTNADYEKAQNVASNEMNEERKLTRLFFICSTIVIAMICTKEVLCHYFDSKNNNSEG